MTGLEHIELPHLKQDLYQAKLPSGLRVVLIPKPDFKETTGMLSVNFGGIDTAFTVNGRAINQPYGLAHFLEHQMFENQGKQDFSQLFTSLGADSNAFTSFTSTTYFFTGLDQIVDNIKLLMELVGQARFTEQSIDKERPIIKQEIDMYQDDPEHRLYAAVLAGLFPLSPLAVDLAGTADSIDQIDQEHLLLAFETFYKSDHMSLVIVGDIVVEEVYRLLTELSTPVDTSEVKVIERSAIAHNPVLKKQSFQMDVAMPKLGLGFRNLSRQHPPLLYKTALKLYLNMLLGWTSTTYQNWYDEGRIDDSFDITIEMDSRFQFVMMLLDTMEPIGMSTKLKQALNKGRASLDVSEEHLFMLKKEMYGEFLTSLDRVDEIASLYLEHSSNEFTYFDFPDILDELTLDVVLEIGEQFFKTADYAEVTIFPV